MALGGLNVDSLPSISASGSSGPDWRLHQLSEAGWSEAGRGGSGEEEQWEQILFKQTAECSLSNPSNNAHSVVIKTHCKSVCPDTIISFLHVWMLDLLVYTTVS